MRGRVGSTLNLFAQFAHDDAQVMRVIEVRTTPTLLHDLTRDHLAGVVRVPNQDKSFASRETSDRPGRIAQRVRACNFHSDRSLHCL
jgi:hypothetical protein